ncbi:hypothetical protein EV702DRAFT_1280459 [Suillus placidus]|uniref:Redoxin domain-containing protein n=1 Tax=Suillus placidus TaxID=48579 RepID=A0A9P7D036_9AGAM|nr:hypothetical protein EV702DRAFT_1280459 [Suillus placidus]
MASVLTNVAQAAHSAAAAMLSAARIEADDPVPQKPVKKILSAPLPSISLEKISLYLGVPGAFTPSCSSQVPHYIADYDKFKAKGVKNIYVVAVNDVFVVKAWKEKLAPQGTGRSFYAFISQDHFFIALWCGSGVHSIADDKGKFTSGSGLLLDASGLLGSPRSKAISLFAQYFMTY